MSKQTDLNAYDERYKRVFAAGALSWNDTRPNLYLSHLLEQLPPNMRCIEFGCGEGYQARFIASKGHEVTAIDLSPTAIAKAIKETPDSPRIRFLVGDVTNALSLNLPEASFDLAVDIGCLQMMAEEEDRSNYLNLIYHVLKPNGKLFLQDGLDLDDVKPQSDDEAKELRELKKLRTKPCGYPVPKRIMTPDGERELVLPLCPACKMLSFEGYIQELTIHGFGALHVERVNGVNYRYEVVVVAIKMDTAK